MLAYLSRIGVRLGVEIRVVGRTEDGPVTVEISPEQSSWERHIIGAEHAGRIFVEPGF